MFAVIYRWRLEPGHEESFTEGWELVTRAIRTTCGSYGSRLHRGDDGTWVAYALWPDSATRDRCDHSEEEEGERLMAAAVAERLPTTTMTVVSDLLAPPS